MALVATGAARLIGRMIRSPLDARDASDSQTQTSVLHSPAEEQRWISEREKVKSLFLVKWGGCRGSAGDLSRSGTGELAPRCPLSIVPWEHDKAPFALNRCIAVLDPPLVASIILPPLSLSVHHPDVSEKRI